ncbi:MAG: ATP synthase F1 subunit delta [Ignavibacteria bacterium]
MINRKSARRYSKALFEVAEDSKILDLVQKDFTDIKKSIEKSRELLVFLQSPIINPEKKYQIVELIFKGKVNEISLKFLEIVSSKKRENILYDICVDFLDYINEKKGIVEAKIKTVIDISEKDKITLINKLKQYTGREIKPKFTVDKTIKGGFVAQIHDTIIDASIRRQLEILGEQFRKGSFLTN